MNSRKVKNVFSFDNQKYELNSRLMHGPANSVFLNLSRKNKQVSVFLAFDTEKSKCCTGQKKNVVCFLRRSDPCTNPKTQAKMNSAFLG